MRERENDDTKSNESVPPIVELCCALRGLDFKFDTELPKGLAVDRENTANWGCIGASPRWLVIYIHFPDWISPRRHLGTVSPSAIRNQRGKPRTGNWLPSS